MESTSEVVMDAQIVKMSHELMGAAMQKIGSAEFSDDEFYSVVVICMIFHPRQMFIHGYYFSDKRCGRR